MNRSNKVFRKNLECLVGCVKIGVVGVIWILKNFMKETTKREKCRKKIVNKKILKKCVTPMAELAAWSPHVRKIAGLIQRWVRF